MRLILTFGKYIEAYGTIFIFILKYGDITYKMISNYF